MKNLFSKLLVACAAVTFFTACEDVPEPYTIKTDDGTLTDGVYIDETFSETFGTFTEFTETGNPWVIDYSTAKAAGYDNDTQTRTATKTWLISEPIDLSECDSAYLTFDYICRYQASACKQLIRFSTDYTDDPTTATWMDIEPSLTEGSDWTNFSNYSTDIPASLLGQKNVTIALYYECTSSSASTWEVKNLKVQDGKASSDESGTEPVEGEYINETFSSSFGVFTANTVKGTAWSINYSTANATGYDNSSKTTTPSEAYLVSTPVDLSKATAVCITFDYILRYYTNYGTAKSGVEDKVLITDNYTGDPSTTSWTDISGTLTEGSDWETFYQYAKNVPSQFLGKSDIVVALYYACADNSATWEVKNFVMEDGSVEEDEPTPTPSGDVLEAENGTFINETFSSEFGVFTANTVKGTAWTIDYSTAKATGYDSSSKTTTASESYLVSKPMNMSSTTAATISFQYILRYYTNYGESKPGVEDKVLITDNYTGDPTTTIWTDITGTLTEGSDWSTFYTYSKAVPSEFLGKGEVVVALYYACGDNSATWEVKNFKVTEDSGDTGGDDNTSTTEGISISGTTVTLTNSGTTAGTETITIDLSTLGYENGSSVETVTLSDGTTIVFDKNGETNGPAYYTKTNGVRVYKNNTITFNGKAKIAKIVLSCDSYNGTNYVGNETATLSSDGNTLVYTNKFEGTSGGGVQLRIKTITVTYAE